MPNNNSRSAFFKPFPVTSLRKQIRAGVLIGATVAFILTVFQPFGTYEFQMQYKTIFLIGYGVVCTLVYIGYYSLLMTAAKKWFIPQDWTILKEIVTVIPVILLIAFASLCYYNIGIPGYNISFSDFIHFSKLSLAVGSIPLTALFYRKWLKNQLTTVTPIDDSTSYTLTIESNNKKEKPVIVNAEDLIYIKSSGNYIEIATSNMSKPYLIRNSLNFVESKLPKSDFIKIHRSYIVNIHVLESLQLNNSSYAVKLKGIEDPIPVSRSAVKDVRALIS